MKLKKPTISQKRGSWGGIPAELKNLVTFVLEQPDKPALYERYRGLEKQSKDILLEFEQNHPDVANENNVNAYLCVAQSLPLDRLIHFRYR